MITDNYELQLSCSGEAAGTAYVAGIDNALRLDHPGITELKEALRLDPDFALAHAALARQLLIHGFRSDVDVHLKKAVTLKAAATEREQSAVDVVVAAAMFAADALHKAQSHIARYPRDVFVLAHIVGPFGLLAFSGQRTWREENVTLLESLQNRFPADDWWYLSSRSFLASEVGDLGGARSFAEQAWRLSENGNTAHSWAHLHFEDAALDEGLSFVDEWVAGIGADSDMRHHLIWHLALLLREKDAGTSELLAIYERELDPRISDPLPLSTFSDNSALLWRCRLSGQEIPLRIAQDQIDYANKHYPNIGFPFVDIHRIMAVALVGDVAQQEALVEDLRAKLATKNTPLAKAMVAYAGGFFAFANREFGNAAEHLEPVVRDSVLLGGSNPQRQVVKETYDAAMLAASP